MFSSNENRFDDFDERYHQAPRRAASPLAMASLVCAILGILTTLTGFFSIMFGSLAVLFSFLSKGSQPKPEKAARYACRIGLFAILLSIVIMIASVRYVISEYGSLENYYNSYLYTIEKIYGIDLESGDYL